MCAEGLVLRQSRRRLIVFFTVDLVHITRKPPPTEVDRAGTGGLEMEDVQKRLKGMHLSGVSLEQLSEVEWKLGEIKVWYLA